MRNSWNSCKLSHLWHVWNSFGMKNRWRKKRWTWRKKTEFSAVLFFLFHLSILKVKKVKKINFIQFRVKICWKTFIKQHQEKKLLNTFEIHFWRHTHKAILMQSKRKQEGKCEKQYCEYLKCMDFCSVCIIYLKRCTTTVAWLFGKINIDNAFTCVHFVSFKTKETHIKCIEYTIIIWCYKGFTVWSDHSLDFEADFYSNGIYIK